MKRSLQFAWQWGLPFAILVMMWMFILTSCAGPVIQSVPTMTFVHHGKPLCAIYLPSSQEPDGMVNMLITKGECPEVVIDDGMPKLGAEGRGMPR